MYKNFPKKSKLFLLLLNFFQASIALQCMSIIVVTLFSWNKKITTWWCLGKMRINELYWVSNVLCGHDKCIVNILCVSALCVNEFAELHVGQSVFLWSWNDWNWEINLRVWCLLDAFFAGDEMKLDLVADAEELLEVFVEARSVWVDLFAKIMNKCQMKLMTWR